MIKKTRHAHTNYNAVKPFIDVVDRYGAARFKAEGYMDLVLEPLYYSDHFGNPVYSIAHYGEQNGDLMRDPDVEFSIDRKAETIMPLSFRNDYIGKFDEVFKTIEGTVCYSRRLLVDLDTFFWQWMQNIDQQGFTPQRREVISANEEPEPADDYIDPCQYTVKINGEDIPFGFDGTTIALFGGSYFITMPQAITLDDARQDIEKNYALYHEENMLFQMSTD